MSFSTGSFGDEVLRGPQHLGNNTHTGSLGDEVLRGPRHLGNNTHTGSLGDEVLHEPRHLGNNTHTGSLGDEVLMRFFLNNYTLERLTLLFSLSKRFFMSSSNWDTLIDMTGSHR